MNRVSMKNCIIVSTDKKKIFDQLQHFFMIKTFSKLVIEEDLFHQTKLELTLHLMMEDEWFPTRFKNRAVIFTLTSPPSAILYWNFYPV